MKTTELETIGKLKTQDLLEEVSRRGFISQRREVNIDRTYELPAITGNFKIGVVSDTHFGSQYQQPTLLHKAYDIMKEQDVKFVLHCGDLLEGSGKMHRDQLYEMFLVGGDKLREYIVSIYPNNGLKTKFIGGNHCASLFVEGGIDPLSLIARERKDMEYLGMYSATIKIGKLSIQLMHPDGGNAYARSYRQQKIIEQLAPEKKPNVLLIGHYHTSNILPQYRGVYAFQLPCFQSQTPYLRRKGLMPEVGFAILHFITNAKGIHSVRVDYFPFFVINQGDY